MYYICEMLINKKRTDGLAEKISKLYLYGQLTGEQYDALMNMLNAGAETAQTA